MIGIISGQVYYFTSLYPKCKAEIREVDNQITTQKQALAGMEDGLKRLPSIRQEIENTKLEVVALIGRMPSYTSVAKDLSDMMSILETSNFTNVQIAQGESIDHIYEGHEFIEREYTISYISPFSDSKSFVENLNSAYQLLNLHTFVTENTPQVDEKSRAAYKLLYGDKFNELVESHITFSLFINKKSEEKEVYDPAINLLINTESAFENIENLLKEDGDITSNYHEGIELDRPLRDNETLFKWQIKDDLTSGDNYRFIGPSLAKNEVYLGMSTKEAIEMSLTLKEKNYKVIIEDGLGRREEISADIGIKDPVIQITSDVIEQADVSKVHMRIDNQTQEVVVVDIEGGMKGNLHIYNEEGEEVNRGGVKGKLIVR